MALHAKFKAAAVQMAPVYLNRDATTEKVCRKIDEAAANGAKVIAFPETVIPGYPSWIWSEPTRLTGHLYKKFYEQAVEIPSKTIASISDAARRNKVYVSVSLTERDRSSLYLTMVWFGPNGDMLGKHRKLKPSVDERTIWGDGDGSMMPCFDTEYGRLAGLNCWNNSLPLAMAAMGSMNEQVHVAAYPTFAVEEGSLYSPETCKKIVQAYAAINGTFVLMPTMIYTQEMIDTVTLSEDAKGYWKLGGGGTQIVGPNGVVLNELPGDVEDICYADIDLDEIITHKYLNDPAGHYATPASLRLIFDRNEHFGVMEVGSPKDTSISYEQLQSLKTP